jgi:hypothetical protein
VAQHAPQWVQTCSAVGNDMGFLVGIKMVFQSAVLQAAYQKTTYYAARKIPKTMATQYFFGK